MPYDAFLAAVGRLRMPDLASLVGPGKKVALAASVLACLGVAGMASSHASTSANQVPAAAFSDADRTAQASRSLDRTVTSSATTAAAQAAVDAATKVLAPEQARAKEEAAKKAADEAAAAKAAEEKKAAEAKAAAQAKAIPTPVAGLNQVQMNNAKRIVEAGQQMGLSKRAYVIAVATAMQESNLYNLASTVLPESFKYSSEGSGSDHDSVGLFQQRPSSGWGSIMQCMDPKYAATAFYKRLVSISGWDTMALSYAAQAVQVSAFPNAYAKHEARAQAVVDALA